MEQLIKKAHGMAKEKGFWDSERNKSELLMLIVSELSEALEALRKNHYANKKAVDELHRDMQVNLWDDEFNIMDGPWKAAFEAEIKSSFEDELADVAIRLFDLCGGLGVDLDRHIELKMMYNSMRGYKHGKQF
jgi:NTP pyrophosphatase (non-canonical NTP hydrolase)